MMEKKREKRGRMLRKKAVRNLRQKNRNLKETWTEIERCGEVR